MVLGLISLCFLVLELVSLVLALLSLVLAFVFLVLTFVCLVLDLLSLCLLGYGEAIVTQFLSQISSRRIFAIFHNFSRNRHFSIFS
jgi:hypothetical protein